MIESPPDGRAGIDAALVTRLLAAQFPQWSDRPVTPVEVDGWDNRTYRLGDDLTVRLPTHESYTPAVDKEHRWLPVLAPSLPVPIPVPLAKGEPGEGYPFPWSVRRWLDGRTASPEHLDDLPAFATSVAEFILLVLGLVTVAGPVAGTAPPAAAIENGLSRTPAMGFNNWNATHCRAEFDEQLVRQIADIFVARGLKDAGYEYVNIDDCWAEPNRDAAGNLVPNRARFPNGIKAVADYVHSVGLKFGIYTSAGTRTCDTQGFPGGIGHEQQDANLFASWGVDYLKYDNCGDHLGQSAQQRYTAMRDALRATGRPIVFSICEWGSNQPWDWAQPVGNSWRTTGDISDNWASMLGIFKANVGLAVHAQRGAWNDPDMLEVGNGGMTDTEYRSHFSLWAMMNAPLLIGSDLRSVGQSTYDILTNRDVIALNQDTLGVQATELTNANGLHVLTKPLDDGDVAVALFNETGSAARIATTASAAGLGNASTYTLRDLWTKATSTTTGEIAATVPAHATVVYRVSRTGTFTVPPAGTTQVSALPASLSASAWGPVEHDRSNGEQAAGDGATLTIGGTTYARGLGVHARSEVRYHLGGRCTSFQAWVGVDDETGTEGSVTLEVWAPGRQLATSGVVRGTDPPRRLTADLTGLQYVHLAVLPTQDGPRYDHADWADATITCPPPRT